MIELTALILTFNERENIGRTLAAPLMFFIYFLHGGCSSMVGRVGFRCAKAPSPSCYCRSGY
jgi:hypothetical protein